jgi:hypothetical protein
MDWGKENSKEGHPSKHSSYDKQFIIHQITTESLMILSRLPISSTTSSSILSPTQQSEMYLRRTIITLLSTRNALYVVLLPKLA